MGGQEEVPEGLSERAAALRLECEGLNALSVPQGPGTARRFAAQLVNPFAVLLWVGSVLAWVAGMPPLAAAIAAVVVLNAVFAFLQELRAERAASRLQALLPAKVTVRRGGRYVLVDAVTVVRDDVLVLRPGDRVAADAHMVMATGLVVDASTFTGESEPVAVPAGADVFAGTFVTEGDGVAVVAATGSATRLSQITQLAAGPRHHHTPLARALRRFVRTVSVVALAVGAVFYLLASTAGVSSQEGFVLALGVVVALLPEGLLPTVTLALAWGAERMSHHQVLVRSLDAVETLGSVTFICTDKTGTLTQNQMTVVSVWTPLGQAWVEQPGYDPYGDVDVQAPARAAVRRAARAARLCSRGHVTAHEGRWTCQGDPMEAAIDVLARRLGLGDLTAAQSGGTWFPFDPRRRRMSVHLGQEVLVKGAPDVILPLCGSAGAHDSAAWATMHQFASRGLRVIAVASRRSPGAPPVTWREAEVDLELLGILGLQDPPRTDVAQALAACRGAGVKVAMITGDHPATASAIADQVGLRQPNDPVYVGDELPEDLEALGALLETSGSIVARVSPEQKLRIAQALRSRGHVVAMTGDGVNDAPALHEADVGVAMGLSGTDVAREAADIVLLDDHFGSIVAGIEHGRATFLNIRRFVTYHLTSNVAELTPFVVWGLSGGSFPLALGVLQVLAIDVGTDTISAVALGAERPKRGLLHRPPVAGRLLNRTVARRAFLVLGPTAAGMSMTAFVVSLSSAGWSFGGPRPSASELAAASGAAYLAVICSQIANAFASRSSTQYVWQLGWTTNRLLLAAVTGSLALALLLLWLPEAARLLGHAVPPAAGWAVGVTAGLATLAADTLDKAVVRRRSEHGHQSLHRTVRTSERRGRSWPPDPPRQRATPAGRGKPG